MKSVATFLLTFFTLFGFAQKTVKGAELVGKTPLDADIFVGYDKFDYRYHVKNNVLYKVKNSESLEYKNLALGQITKVDLQNPLKVIVFYERFNTVITLDSQLNETLKIDFSQIKRPLVVSKTGIASQNQLWVFDEVSQQLFLYDTINGNLKAVGTPLSEAIVYYNSDFNNFEWMDKKNDWYRCSIFGNVEGMNYDFDFDVILFANSTLIVYRKDEKIFVLDKNSKQNIFEENSNNSDESVTYKNQILSIFTSQEIKNYKITIP